MKILVVHDSAGKISSIGIPAVAGVGLNPPAGKRVSEIDAPEIKSIGGGDESAHAQVLAIAKQFRVVGGVLKKKAARK